MARYVHQTTDKDILMPAGCYTPLEEVQIELHGRRVLYVVGESNAESSCCASGKCGYAVVPGFILRWKHGTDDEGQPVSEVEPIQDDKDKQEIADAIRERHGVSNIRFS